MWLDCMKSYPNYIPMINPPNNWSSPHDLPMIPSTFPSPPPAGCALFAASRRPTPVLGADADATHWPLLQACHPPENAGKMLGKLWEFLGNVPDISWNVQKSPVMLWSKHGHCRNHQGNCYKDVERCWNSQINSWPISSFLCKPDLAISCNRHGGNSCRNRSVGGHSSAIGAHGALMGPSPSMSRKRLICWT